MKKSLIFFLFISVGFSESIETIVVSSDTQNPTNISSDEITKQDIEVMLNGNGDIASTLRLNPNIVVENKNIDKEGISDIKDSKIRINGAKFYQNSMLLDGMSNDSLIDPTNDNKYAIDDVVGNENAMYIDLDLVDSINVYDSLVSARYGNFNGGVIDVKLKRANFDSKTKFSTRFTNDSLVNFHTIFQEDKNGGSIVAPKRFSKRFFSIYHNEPINENSAIMGTYSYKSSTTPKEHFDTFKDTTQENHNLLVKYSYFYDDDSILDVTAIASKYENTLFRANVKDSEYKNVGSGINLKANYEKDFSFGGVESMLSLSRMENSRKDSPKDYFGWKRQGDKLWGIVRPTGTNYSYEGGFGDIKKINDIIDFNTQTAINPFDFLSMHHKFISGIDIKYAKSYYDRKENSYQYYEPQDSNTINCNGADGCISGASGQYFQNRRVYLADKVDVDMASFGAFAEDSIKYKRFVIKPGVRVDFNTYLKNIDISPRLNSTFDIFGDKGTIFFTGVNRYYGKSFLAFKLREAKLPYQTEYRGTYNNTLNLTNLPANNNPTIWNISSAKGDNIYIYNNLKTPYSDEFVVGLKQDIFGNVIEAKYITREYKDQFKEIQGEYKSFVRKDGKMAYYRPITTTNQGESEYNIFSINIKNEHPFSLFGGDFFYNFSTSINTKNRANFTTYDYENESIEQYVVLHNGDQIDINNLPKEKSAKTAKLFLALSGLNYHIFGYKAKTSFSTTLNYTHSHKSIEKKDDLEETTIKLPDGTDHKIDVVSYIDKKYSSYMTIDAKINLFFPIYKKHTLTTSLEVTNLFDKIVDEQISTQGYAIGRQLWLEFAYNF